MFKTCRVIFHSGAESDAASVGNGAGIGSGADIGSGAGSIYAFLFKTCLRRVVSSSAAALRATQTVSAMAQASVAVEEVVLAAALEEDSGADRVGNDAGIGSGAGSIYAFLFKTCLRRVVSSSAAALRATQTLSAMAQASVAVEEVVLAAARSGGRSVS